MPFNEKAGRFGDNNDAALHFRKLHEIMSKGVGVNKGVAAIDAEKYTVGPTLTFDSKTEKHTGDYAEEANQLLKDPNNPDFKIPTLAEV